jgi:hypothetical protein
VTRFAEDEQRVEVPHRIEATRAWARNRRARRFDDQDDSRAHGTGGARHCLGPGKKKE